MTASGDNENGGWRISAAESGLSLAGRNSGVSLSSKAAAVRKLMKANQPIESEGSSQAVSPSAKWLIGGASAILSQWRGQPSAKSSCSMKKSVNLA